MSSIRIANPYAKSLMDIAIEHSQLDAVYADMQMLQYAVAGSKELDLMMKSPIIKSDIKKKSFDAVFAGKLNDITSRFITLLITKSRENVLKEIIDSFIDKYKKHNNIATVKLTTAEPLSDEMKAYFEQKIGDQLKGQKLDFELKSDEKLIGGFLLETNNQLFDASIAHDLKAIRKQFLENVYVPNIR